MNIGICDTEINAIRMFWTFGEDILKVRNASQMHFLNMSVFKTGLERHSQRPFRRCMLKSDDHHNKHTRAAYWKVPMKIIYT